MSSTVLHDKLNMAPRPWDDCDWSEALEAILRGGGSDGLPRIPPRMPSHIIFSGTEA